FHSFQFQADLFSLASMTDPVVNENGDQLLQLHAVPVDPDFFFFFQRSHDSSCQIIGQKKEQHQGHASKNQRIRYQGSRTFQHQRIVQKSNQDIVSLIFPLI